jgi:hypothetical protein
LIDEPKAGDEENQSDDIKRVPVPTSSLPPAPERQTQADEPTETTQHRPNIVGRFVAFWINFWRRIERGNRNLWQRVWGGFLLADKHHGAISALATVAIVVLTVFYVQYSKRQWEEMRSAKRPWVGLSERLTLRRQPSFSAVEPAITGLDGEKEFVIVTFEVSGSLQNFGASPARRVYEFFNIMQYSELPYQSRESYCKVAGSESRGENPFPQFGSSYFTPQPVKAIFPNIVIPIQSATLTFGMFVDKTPRLPNPLYVIGCVAYQDTFGDVHHTKVLYRSSVPAGSRQETALEKPSLVYLPFTEFVMEDSDGD